MWSWNIYPRLFFCWLWEDLLKIDELNVDKSTKIYLDTYAPLKKINKYKLKFKSKPWIVLVLQKSISVKKSYLQISLIISTLY